MLRELTRKGALLDLLLVNREGLVSEEVIGGCLEQSNHEANESKISVDRRKNASKTSSLDTKTADFGLLRDRVSKVPCENAFESFVVHQCQSF